jgi:hypothetical protein
MRWVEALIRVIRRHLTPPEPAWARVIRRKAGL